MTTLYLLGLLAASQSASTILKAIVVPTRVAPGGALKITYSFDAKPIKEDGSVFVHILGPTGVTVLQDDHQPNIPTSMWSGPLRYVRTIGIPKDLPDGHYRVLAGLTTRLPDGEWKNFELKTGAGVMTNPFQQYEIASFDVDHAASPPPLDSAKKPTLNLNGYRLAFHDEFDGPLDVTAHGPSRWTAHKPDGQDFGDAKFVDPQPGFPFTTKDGLLRIEARKDLDGWKSGILSTCDPQGRGFAQKYGYFEMRAKFPKGPGTWPAFWLLKQDHLLHKDHPDVEFDVLEQYGIDDQAMHSTVHVWGKTHTAFFDTFRVEDMTDGFHRYGVMWDAKDVTFYFDGVEMFRTPTPKEADGPMYPLINLALGSGWPIDKTPNPSVMLVDYVRVYAKQ